MLKFINKTKAGINIYRLIYLIFLLVITSGFQSTIAQSFNSDFVRVANGYVITPNITYIRAGGEDLKLDVYQPGEKTGPNPTLIYFHGGGWTASDKESVALDFLPFMEQGWTVVNVEYRLASSAHAPAAVEDARCALRWIYRNAEEYGFDLDKIVASGTSAGGHLALTTGMLSASAGLDHQCPGDRTRIWNGGTSSTQELKVAAIINWYGITDVNDLQGRPAGPAGAYTDAWLGSDPDRLETAARVSPINYVREGLPPVMTIHGDKDPSVHYSQAVRLHEALDKAGVPNELVTVKEGGHGEFSQTEMVRIYDHIGDFLRKNNLGPTK